MTSYTYNDTASPPNKSASTDGHWVYTQMDGFGRTVLTTTGYSTTTLSLVDTQYAPCGCSPLGKLSQQSQPYAPGGSDAWTVYHYDASGRTTSVVLPEGSSTTYQYQGNVVTVTDPAGKLKTFTMDAFGNLVTVVEPDPTLGNVTTSYTYDVLNHLIHVSMPRGSTTQTRTFNYNSGTTVTGLLQSATNPENGTVTYTYNWNLLGTKTDAKGQQLAYWYDTYNRLTSVYWYNAPGGAQLLRTHYYDTNPLDSTGFSQNALGRLTAVQYPAFATNVQMNDMYSYFQSGLPAAKRLQANQLVAYNDINNHLQHQTVTANLDSTYTYNDEGQVTGMTYPSTIGVLNVVTAGASYNYSYDSMNRLGGMTSGSTTVVNGVSYDAANRLLGMTFNSLSESRSYNVLGQLTNINVQNLGYPYGTAENLTYNYPTGGTNNGKVSSMYNAVSGETVTYAYDSLNRMATAAGSGWGESYTLDPYGNLTTKQVTAGSGPSLSVSVNSSNQITSVYGQSYDANGNTRDGNMTAYDAENRLTGVGWNNGAPAVDYSYDAQNKRIFMWTAGTVDSYNNTYNYTVVAYSPSGQKLGTYLFAPQQPYFQGGINTPYITVSLESSDQYFGGRRLAAMDQLGSAGTYYPWGEAKGSTNPQDTWSYATYWRDSATGLDYARNRYYSNVYGRFMTVDPKGGYLSNPQSLNRYAYVLGDPVNRNDPRGLCSVMISGITMGPGTNSAWSGEASSLTADTAYPYSGQGITASSASVLWQAQEGSNAATYTAYYMILAAEASSSTPIDIIAYSGGAGAFAAAWNLLTAAQQADIGSIVYVAPGSAGATLPSNGSTSTFVGGSGPVNGVTSVGTNPVGNVTNTTCNHTDLNCLFQWAAGTIGNGGGPCAQQYSLTLQQTTAILSAVSNATQQQLFSSFSQNVSNYMVGLADDFLNWVEGIPVGGPDTEVDSTISYVF